MFEFNIVIVQLDAENEWAVDTLCNGVSESTVFDSEKDAKLEALKLLTERLFVV